MYDIGSVQSDVWTVNTFRVITAPPIPTFYLLAAGAELTGGLSNPNSFYTHVDTEEAISDPIIWGASSPGGTASYMAGKLSYIASRGLVFVGHGEWGGNDAIITKTADYGRTWTEVARVDTLLNFQGIAENIAGNKIWACTKGKVYESNDDGDTWVGLPGTISNAVHPAGSIVTCVCETPNGDMYAGCQHSSIVLQRPPIIMKSTDQGTTWSAEYVISEYRYANTPYWFAVNKICYNNESNRLWAMITTQL